MHFESGHLYHIYNQGNNREKIFFSRDNYLFFLDKIRTHIIPYADILAWCLMPNHFHLMVRVNRVSQSEDDSTHTKSEGDSARTGDSRPPTTENLNKSIGIMLASYTRAINKQKGRSGSLFRTHCKSIKLTQPDKNSKNWYSLQGITYFKTDTPNNNYPNTCFHYIHNNPVKSGLVRQKEAWEFSSAKDVLGLRDGSLINQHLITEYGLVLQ